MTNQIQKTGATTEGGGKDDTDFKHAEFDQCVPYLGGTWKHGS